MTALQEITEHKEVYTKLFGREPNVLLAPGHFMNGQWPVKLAGMIVVEAIVDRPIVTYVYHLGNL